MTEDVRRASGNLYHPFRLSESTWKTIRVLCKNSNESDFWRDTSALEELKRHFGQADGNVVLTPPFYCDCRNHIFFQGQFYANTGLTMLDESDAILGADILLGPHVSIYTAAHPVDAAVGRLGLEYALPVRIGNQVWIGGNTLINPGVTIGDDVVIGSGSVVVGDIPGHVVAAGNPCRVIRPISEEEHRYWSEQLEQYQYDPDILATGAKERSEQWKCRK